MLYVDGYQLELVGWGHNKYYRACRLSIPGTKDATFTLTQWGARGAVGQTKVMRFSRWSTADPETLWTQKRQKGYSEIVHLDFVAGDLPEELPLGPLSLALRASFNEAWEEAWAAYESMFVHDMEGLPAERPSEVLLILRRVFDDAAVRPWLSAALGRLSGPRAVTSNGDVVCAVGARAADRLRSRFFSEVVVLGQVGEATPGALVETTAMVWQPRGGQAPLADPVEALVAARAVLAC